jgi:membrane-bound metal-dependent hydrolase YbcI (DUF457 family)
MKGIAHFVTGIAVATLFPEVVHRAADGSLLPVLGGVAALLPDTLDFKLLRYLQPYDLEIDPGPEPDPCPIAQALARAAHEAYQTRVSRRVMCHTIRLGPDRWRRYTLRVDPDVGEIAVDVGPIVDTGQRPELGSTPQTSPCVVPLAIPIDPRSRHEIVVDIFSGPSLTFQRRGDRLHVGFLDWHRRWSHSLTFAAVLGLAAAGIAALFPLLTGRPSQPSTPPLVGAVVSLGLLTHSVQDQLGFMGSNLLFPITRQRTPGLGLIHSGDAVPNFLTVWAAVMLILFNLDRFSAQPQLPPWWIFFGLAVLLPSVALGALYVRNRQRKSGALPGEQDELIAELEDTAIG